MSRADEPAFPAELPLKAYPARVHSGLTVREHYAGLAMQAILTGAVTRGCPSHEWDDEISQKKAVSVADRLIAELAKPVTP